ncbi:MAG TPA: cytochrome c3 family protein [Bryobacteraceae bacterium]|jgi:hypothetical protein
MRLLVLSLAAGLLLMAQPKAPEQPVPYSHKLHAGTLKLKCAMCHKNADPGETMGFPPVATCMQCHSAIKTDSPEVQKLAAAAKENRQIEWVRVYQIPSYVDFSHRAHLESGNQCSDCHADVTVRDRLFREGDISMGGCMNCHRLKKASIDCNYCHEEKQ